LQGGFERFSAGVEEVVVVGGGGGEAGEEGWGGEGGGEAVCVGEGDGGVELAVAEEVGEFEVGDFFEGFEVVAEVVGGGEEGVVLFCHVGHGGEGAEGEEGGEGVVGAVAPGEVDGDGSAEGPAGGDEVFGIDIGAGEDVLVGGLGGVVAALFGGGAFGHAEAFVVDEHAVGAHAAEHVGFGSGGGHGVAVAVEVEDGGWGIFAWGGVAWGGVGFAEEGGEGSAVGGLEVEEFGAGVGLDVGFGGAGAEGSGEDEVALEGEHGEHHEEVHEDGGAGEANEEARGAGFEGDCNGGRGFGHVADSRGSRNVRWEWRKVRDFFRGWNVRRDRPEVFERSKRRTCP